MGAQFTGKPPTREGYVQGGSADADRGGVPDPQLESHFRGQPFKPATGLASIPDLRRDVTSVGIGRTEGAEM